MPPNMTLQEAIARQEGFGVAGSRATRNNNPGNLRIAGWLNLYYGAQPDDAGFARFSDKSLGWAALTSLLYRSYRGMTVRAALNKFAPASDGNAPDVYVANVCEWTGATPDSLVDGLL